MPETNELIREFLAAPVFAVVGASRHPEKYGAKVFAAYRQRGLEVYPVNPKESEIQGVRAYPTLAALPSAAPSISVITPPAVTERIIEDAARAGVTSVWLQPGAESELAIRRGATLGLRLIHSGPCILVTFASRGSP